MNLTIPEIIILQSGAIVLGFVIHHFFISKKNNTLPDADELQKQKNAEIDWKLTYSGEIEMKEREITKLKQKLADAEENLSIYEIEIEERSKEAKKLKNTPAVNVEEVEKLKEQLREALEDNNILQIEVEERIKEVKKLKSEQGTTPQPVPVNTEEVKELKKRLADAGEENNILQIEISELRKQIKELKSALEQSSPLPDKTTSAGQAYYDQLQQAQQSLKQENERISRLLEQIDIIKEKEEKQQEMMSQNLALNSELVKLKEILAEKENEINAIRQKATITTEMSSMLDNAYSEFNVLQDKMHKLEVQITTSRMVSMELDDLKESHYRLSKDYEEQKLKLHAAITEKQQYFRELTESEEKLKEANFQRQQLQKKVTYLEELTRDLNLMAAANKKLEGQIRRIGELESMLNIVEEERDELKKQVNKPS
jgi:chromosome segregation ATPase